MRSRTLLGWGVALAATTMSCGDAGPPRDVNFLLVSIDTLRADRLGAYGNTEWGESPSPSLDALAEAGILFETAYAPRGQTHPSLASMLTGKYPITTGLRENGFPLSREHTTLFEHLQAAGVQTGVFIANLEVRHPAEEWVARGADRSGDGFGGGRPAMTANDESRLQAQWDDRVEEGALAYLRSIDGSRPFALWAHFYDPHKPYNPPLTHVNRYGLSEQLPPVLRNPGPNSANALEQHLGAITLGMQDASEAELTRIRGLYDATVRRTDNRLANLLAELEKMGELDNTYILFTSDHGEELYDHNRYFYHGSSIYDGVLRLPLVIRGPDVLQGLRSEQLVRNIDIAPTMLDLMGLPGDPAMEGISFAPLLRGESSVAPIEFAVAEWQDLIYAVSDGRHKLIYNDQHVHTRKSPYASVPGAAFRIDCIEAYDLEADPHEQVNLLKEFDLAALDSGRGLPQEFRPHFKALREFLSDPAHQGGLDLDSLDAQQRQRLAQIGYVSSVSANRSDSIRRAPCVDR
jgi:arylsulfatase